MSPLELALVLLVTIWSIIFVVIGVSLVLLLREVKKALDSINHILENAENITEDVGSSLKTAASGVAGLLANNLIRSVFTKVAKLKQPKKK